MYLAIGSTHTLAAPRVILEGPIAHSASVSSDQSLAILQAPNNEIQILDIGTQKVLRTVSNEKAINSTAISTSGVLFATGSEDYTAKIRDVNSGEIQHILQHSRIVTSVAFSYDGSRLITGCDDGKARIWAVESGDLIRTLDHSDVPNIPANPDPEAPVEEEYVVAVSLSRDGKLAVTGSSEKTAKIWDVESGNLLHTLSHGDWVISVVFSPNGKQVATGSRDHTVSIWDTQSGKKLKEFRQNGWVRDISISEDGKQIASGSDDKTASIWDVATGQVLHTIQHNRPVRSVSFSVNGGYLYSGAVNSKFKVSNLYFDEQRAMMLFCFVRKYPKKQSKDCLVGVLPTELIRLVKSMLYQNSGPPPRSLVPLLTH